MKNILLTLALIVFFNSFGQTQKEFYTKGFKKYQIGEYVDAIREFDKVIEINTNNTTTDDAIYFRAQARYFIKDFYGSIYDFTTYLNKHYEFSEGYWNRGIVKEALGDKTGACKDYKIAYNLYDGYKSEYNEKCN